MTGVPPEPPIGTWVKDRFGAASHRGNNGYWGEPGFYYLASWEPMWKARGPLVECAPWGVETMDVQECPRCKQRVTWDEEHEPAAWRHDHDSRWCSLDDVPSDTGPVMPAGCHNRFRQSRKWESNPELWV